MTGWYGNGFGWSEGCFRRNFDTFHSDADNGVVRDNLNRFVKSGAVVLGLSADSVESRRKFKEKKGLNFPLLSDPDHKALEAYGVWQEKSLYGRKFMGFVRNTFIIDADGKIARTFPKVKVAGHVDAVLAAFANLNLIFP
ncbi:MAG: peroxiredoxin [Fibrobacteria bacterium]